MRSEKDENQGQIWMKNRVDGTHFFIYNSKNRNYHYEVSWVSFFLRNRPQK